MEVQLLGGFTVAGHLRLLVKDDDSLQALTQTGPIEWAVRPVTGLPAIALARIQTVGESILAIGSAEGAPPTLWVSKEGFRWDRIPIPAEAGLESTLWGVAVADDRAVLVGQVERSSVAVGAIWIAPASIVSP
jgi:hypothetical protein